MLTAKIRARAMTLWPVRPGKCASSECNRVPGLWWQMIDDAATVQLSGSTFCFPDCFERELKRTMERTMERLSTPSNGPRPRRMPLGLLMLSRGSLSQQQLRHALNAQHGARHGKIGEWISQLGFANEYEIAGALAQQWACPLMRTLPLGLADCDVPIYLLQSLRTVPVHFFGPNSTLHLAFAHGIDYQALVAIENIMEIRTEACLTTERELIAALNRMEERHTRTQQKFFGNCRGVEEVIRIISTHTAALRASEVRCVTCGEFLWARILARVHSVNLLFLRKDVQAPAGARLS